MYKMRVELINYTFRGTHVKCFHVSLIPPNSMWHSHPGRMSHRLPPANKRNRIKSWIVAWQSERAHGYVFNYWNNKKPGSPLCELPWQLHDPCEDAGAEPGEWKESAKNCTAKESGHELWSARVCCPFPSPFPSGDSYKKHFPKLTCDAVQRIQVAACE